MCMHDSAFINEKLQDSVVCDWFCLTVRDDGDVMSASLVDWGRRSRLGRQCLAEDVLDDDDKILNHDNDLW